MSFVYVLTKLDVPGAGTVTHAAELEEIDPSTARMRRLIQLSETTVTGLWDRGVARGEIAAPHGVVPHPDTYADFPDIRAERLDANEFESRWEAARRALGAG